MADDEKSFRELVEEIEEIRERREQERNDDNSHVGLGAQVNQQGNIQPNIPNMDEFLEQFGTELSGCRITVETDDTRLEFHDQSIYKTQMNTGPMYQLIGEPDRKEPIHGDTESLDAALSSSANSTTKVFTPDSTGGSESQDESIGFCPGCGSDIGSFADVQHCPSCGRKL